MCMYVFTFTPFYFIFICNFLLRVHISCATTTTTTSRDFCTASERLSEWATVTRFPTGLTGSARHWSCGWSQLELTVTRSSLGLLFTFLITRSFSTWSWAANGSSRSGNDAVGCRMRTTTNNNNNAHNSSQSQVNPVNRPSQSSFSSCKHGRLCRLVLCVSPVAQAVRGMTLCL